MNVALGAWLICAPWALDYVSATASDNDVWIGALVLLLGITSAAFTKSAAPAHVNVALGVWLLLAPWILAYRPPAALATINDIIAGLLIIAFGAARIWGARRRTAVMRTPRAPR